MWDPVTELQNRTGKKLGSHRVTKFFRVFQIPDLSVQTIRYNWWRILDSSMWWRILGLPGKEMVVKKLITKYKFFRFQTSHQHPTVKVMKGERIAVISVRGWLRGSNRKEMKRAGGSNLTFYVFFFSLRAISNYEEGFLLDLWPGLTPGSARGHMGWQRLNPSQEWKTILPIVLLLQI